MGLLPACQSVYFVGQATWGQLDLLSRAQPIERLTRKPSPAPPPLRMLLAEVSRIKAFGEQHGLRRSSNYRTYAELDRDAAVYVVTAAPPLDLTPKVWRFPIVGSFPYLGWFSRDDAEHTAAALDAQGYDVYVRGARAYSTLGWFEDPILSTMILDSPHPRGDLVNIILHEATHATIHITDQSFFNESLATYVGDHLTVLYLADTFGAQHPETLAYLRLEARRAMHRGVLLDTYVALANLYQSKLPPADQLTEKERIVERAQQQLRTRRPINNARLAGIKTYRAGGVALDRLAARCGRRWPAFMAALRRLRGEDFGHAQQKDLAPVLNALGQTHC